MGKNNCEIQVYSKDILYNIINDIISEHIIDNEEELSDLNLDSLSQEILDEAKYLSLKSAPTIKQDVQDILEDVIYNEGSSEDKDIVDGLYGKIMDKLGVPVNTDAPNNPEPESKNTTDEDNKPIKQQKEKVRVILSRIFRTSIGPKEYRQQLLSQDLFKCICVGSDLIVDDQDLNNAIVNLKNKYYTAILNYLEKQGYNTKYLPETLFNSKGQVSGGYEVVLRLFERDILPDISIDKIRFGWRDSVNQTESENALLFNVLNSYLNLRYFDTFLKDKVGKVIGISKNVEENVEVDKNQQKYFFRSTINDLAKGWETKENQDALETTSRFSKLLIENVKMYNYETGRDLKYPLSTASFAGAFSNLFNALALCNNKNEVLIEYLNNMHRNPRKYIKMLLHELFYGVNKKNLKDSLLENGLNQYDLNVLYSVDKFLFSDENSIEKIEFKYSTTSQSTILPNQYPLVECVMGVVDRLMSANYLQCVVNNEGNLEVSIKDKFRSSFRVFNVKNKVNNTVINRDSLDRAALKQKYQFTRIDAKSWQFNIGRSTYKITASGSSVFQDKNTNIEKIDIDGDGNEVRVFIDFEKLTKSLADLNNQELNDILQFIQDQLQPIRTLSELGREKLIAGSVVNKSLLKEMFISAARCGVVNTLYFQYENSEQNENFFNWVTSNYFELSGDASKDKNIWSNTQGVKNLLGIRIFDEWLNFYVQGEAIVDGSIGQSTTKDLNGNSIGNFSTSFLGGNIFYYLNQANYDYDLEGNPHDRVNSVQKHLLGAKQPQVVKGVLINLDSTNEERTEKKLTKQMNMSELLQQSIFHNFYGAFFKKGSNKYVIQPTTYSDKTKIILYSIDALTRLGGKVEDGTFSNKLMKDLTTNDWVDLYMYTVGNFYKQAFNNTVNKFRTVFGLDSNTSFEEVLQTIENEINSKYLDTASREEALISLAESNGIELATESDYIINKDGKIQFNPLLDYYNNYLFKDKQNLINKFNKEKINFINDILASNTIFYTSRVNGESTQIGQIIQQAYPSMIVKSDTNLSSPLYDTLDLKVGQNIQTQYLINWTNDNKLILAKSNKTGKSYIMGEVIPKDDDVTLNPLLNNYFYANSTLATNLRLSLTGTELAHPIKLSGVTLPNPNSKDTSYYDNPLFSRIESVTQGAQLKRNVIIPATLQYFQQGTLRGVPNKLKVAVIKDVKAPAFNYSGTEKNIDSSDGSGHSNSLITIIENFSLQDQRVGTVKKTIAHAPNYTTGGTFLGKWAINGITAEKMHKSLGSDTSLYDLDKKMLNQQWYLENGELNTEFISKERMTTTEGVEQEIDLLTIIAPKGTKNLSKSNNFQNDILKGRQLLYRNPDTGEVWKIQDFGKENGIYYTVEHKHQGGNNFEGEGVKVYHIFDENSNDIRISDPEIINNLQLRGRVYFDLDGKTYHTINSNFELRESLGGIYAVERDTDDGSWIYNDSASYATCEFINLIAFRKSSRTRRSFDQEDFYQPLKHAMIHYAVNSSAVKNGAANINQKDAWTDPVKRLHYMVCGYDGIGVQQDSDHAADEHLLTEFSQVISSLDALGKLHQHAKNIFTSLQKVARAASSTEIEVLENFLQELKQHPDQKVQLLSGLYDFVARAIINNFKNNNEANLAEEVVMSARKYFDQNLNHLQDEFKVPFSDPGIFASIMPIFANQINVKSVKRKYPGSGYVMCPGYGMMQVYDLDGYQYQFDDIVQEIRTILKKAPKEVQDLYAKQPQETFIQWEKRIVNQYLQGKQADLIAKSIEEGRTGRNQFMPTDNVIVRIFNNRTQQVDEFKISLSSVEEYVTFTNDYWWLLLTKVNKNISKDDYILEDAQFFKDITRPRDLAPSKYTWKDTSGGIHNVFELNAIRKGFTANISFTDELGNVQNIEVPKSYVKKSTEEIERFVKFSLGFINATNINITKNQQEQSEIDKVFDNLNEGVFEDNDGNIQQVIDLETKHSEVILSSMHRSKFPRHSSLPNLLKHSKTAFAEKATKNIPGLEGNAIALLHQSNIHSFITFNKPATSDKESGFRELQFKHTKLVEEVISPARDGQPEVRGLVLYSIDPKSSLLQHPIGILKPVPSTEALQNNRLKKGYKRSGENYYRVQYFLQQYSRKHSIPVTNAKGEETSQEISHNIYYIDKDLIAQTFGNYVVASNIISKLYESLGSKELRVNLKEATKDLAQIVKGCQFIHKHEQDLKNELVSILSEKDLTPIGDLQARYESYLDNTYYTSLSHIKTISFLRSLEVICSRIPAQTLQSFLQGQTVGFLQAKENHCYVSHWQLFLQGSDYDIDKSYIMGPAISDQGIYYTWSPLFDFYSIKTLHASEQNIPISSTKKIFVPRAKSDNSIILNFVDKKTNTAGWDITDYVIKFNSSPRTEEARVENLKLFGQFLQELENKKEQTVTITMDYGKIKDNEQEIRKKANVFVGLINSHLNYQPTETVRENMIRNNIQSGIGYVVSDIRNVVHAHNPVNMEDIQQDPMNARVMSMMNPATTLIMQLQNMVGKDVISISAVGEKIFFTLTYYWNEALRNHNIDMLNFQKTFNRIQNRSLGKPIKTVVDSLSNVNFDFQQSSIVANGFTKIKLIIEQINLELEASGLEKDSPAWKAIFDDKFKQEVKKQHSNESKTDIFISELLSAATDNAKELILAQINAGSDLAGLYMYMLSLGFNIKDVVAYMTSPALLSIHNLSAQNMFNPNKLDLNIGQLVKLLQGDFSVIGEDDFNNKFKEEGLTIQESFKNYIIKVINNQEREPINLVSGRNKDFIQILVKSIINSVEGDITKLDDFFADLEELQRVVEGSREHTNLGSIFLSLNQGLPTSQEDLLSKLQRINNITKDRLRDLGITGVKQSLAKEEINIDDLQDDEESRNILRQSKTFQEIVQIIKDNNPKLDDSVENILLDSMLKTYVSIDGQTIPPMFFRFNVRQWLLDDQYKKDTIQFYNLIKSTWNIFDVVDKVPQYNELINLLKLIYGCNNYLVLKSRIINIIHQKFLDRGTYMDETSYKGLMEYIDDKIVNSYLTKKLLNYKFTIPENFGYLNQEAVVTNNTVDLQMDLRDINGIANFRRFMEEHFIKLLQSSTSDLTDLIGVPNISNNSFISNLVKEVDSRSGKFFYKLDIDMMNVEKGIAQQTLYEDMLEGLMELSKIKYNGYPLSDWFMIYNLIVNKNRYGSDRMTTIFKSFIDTHNKEQASVYNNYYNYIGDVLDYKTQDDLENSLGINYQDIELYMAPYVPEYMEANSRAKYIKQYKDGFIVYKVRINKNYQELPQGISKRILLSQTQDMQQEIKKNTLLYYPRTNPNADNIQYFRNKLTRSEGEDDLQYKSNILDALRLLEANKILFIDVNCG